LLKHSAQLVSSPELVEWYSLRPVFVLQLLFLLWWMS
jgi:hypothetical protein